MPLKSWSRARVGSKWSIGRVATYENLNTLVPSSTCPSLTRCGSRQSRRCVRWCTPYNATILVAIPYIGWLLFLEITHSFVISCYVLLLSIDNASGAYGHHSQRSVFSERQLQSPQHCFASIFSSFNIFFATFFHH